MPKQVLCALAAIAVVLTCALPPRCYAHNGGILIQLQDNKLAIGADIEETGVPPDLSVRVFTSLMAPEYSTRLPSFLSRNPAPEGTEEIPPGAELHWDFLPMTIGGEVSNLWYWPGNVAAPESVDFTPVDQPGVNLGHYNVTDSGPNRSAVVTGTPEMVPGGLLGVADTFGNALRLHRHNYFALDDGDENSTTTPPEGVYLLSMQLRMEGAMPSDPFFVVAGTYDLISTSYESLEAAVMWVEENQQQLILAGDYNFDGLVDAEDYAVWKQQFGSAGPFPIDDAYADGNRDGVVNLADYVVWRNQLGIGTAPPNGPAGQVATTVPEPSGWVLTLLEMAVLTAAHCGTRGRLGLHFGGRGTLSTLGR